MTDDRCVSRKLKDSPPAPILMNAMEYFIATFIAHETEFSVMLHLRPTLSKIRRKSVLHTLFALQKYKTNVYYTGQIIWSWKSSMRNVGVHLILRFSRIL